LTYQPLPSQAVQVLLDTQILKFRHSPIAGSTSGLALLRGIMMPAGGSAHTAAFSDGRKAKRLFGEQLGLRRDQG
jgi:hypothetical protein